MKISFITTVINEEKTIEKFLDSILAQTKLPEEIVIVDGNSTDSTVERIKNPPKGTSTPRVFASSRWHFTEAAYDLKFKKKGVELKLIVKKGNRSIGRNEAIRNASGNIIVCSDGGNILDKNWLKNIIEAFKDPQVDVVAGYYKGLTKNVFHQCLIPYVLVMPDKADPENFLPAARSMAFRKSIWNRLGGFPEEFSHNEDYVFAKRLKKIGAKIVFEKNAIVYWIPPTSVCQTFRMFWRFAYGDMEAGIVRPKVVLLFVRYILAFILILLLFIFKSPIILNSLFIILILYSLWAVVKNYKYVRRFQAVYILPFLQFLSDIAVLGGSILGIIQYTWVTRKQHSKA